MSRYQVWLNGLALHSLDPAIRITDVQELVPQQLLTTAARAAGDGLHILRQSRQSLCVEVRFVIREYRVEKRKALLQAVQSWACHGGALFLGDRPGQQLRVVMQEPPHLQSALRWTEELSLCFAAFQSPYWEQITPACFPAGQVTLPGNGPPAPVDFRWTAASSLESFSVETPVSRMHLNLSIAPGQVLTLTHTASVPVITLDGQDVLTCRTLDSSDDLLLPCGIPSTVDISSGQCTFSARGRWL